MQEDVAVFNFLVEVGTVDYNLLNNFGTELQFEFQQMMIRALMIAAAEQDTIVSVSVSPVNIKVAAPVIVEKENEVGED